MSWDDIPEFEVPELQPIPFRETEAGKFLPKSRTLRLGAGPQGELRIPMEDLWRVHTLLIGKSGLGKSVALYRIATALMHEPNVGLCVLDPHAQLAEGMLRYAATLHPRLAKRLVVLDPSGQLGGGGQVLGLNPLSMGEREEEYVLGSMQSALLHAWGNHDANVLPRLVRALTDIFHTVRACGLTVAETLPLLDISKKSPERERLLAGIRNRLIEADLQMLEGASAATRLEQLESALNRLRRFLISPITRNILGAQKRVLDLSAVFEESKILIVNLNGGTVLSRELTRSLGCLVLAELFRAAKGRDVTNPRLKPFVVMIDEAGQLMSKDLAGMLEEVRKFKVGVVAAAQTLSQFSPHGQEDILPSVLGNTRTRIAMGCSHEDALVLCDEVTRLDPHKVKEERWTVRERHIEELRKVVTTSHQKGKSHERSVTEGEQETEGESTGTGTTDTTSSQNTRTKTHQVGAQSSSSTGSASSQHASQTGDETPRVTSGSGQAETSAHVSGSSTTDGESEADGSGTAKSTKHEASSSRTKGRSRGTTYGEGESETSGVSEAQVPFHRVEEVPELASKTYYTMEELRYLEATAIQNQGVGEATVKLPDQPPVRIKLDYASPPPNNPRVTPRLMEKLWKGILAANGSYYQSLPEAQREMDERQTRFFGQPLLYELPPDSTDGPAVTEVVRTDPKRKGPFEV